VAAEWARLLELQADRVQVEMDVSAGLLCDVAEFDRAIRNYLTALRNAAMEIPNLSRNDFPSFIDAKMGIHIDDWTRAN
jgi:hypothetical protein